MRAFDLGYGDPPLLLDMAREASPDFAMAHLARAWLFVLANDPTMLDHARILLPTVGSLTLMGQSGTAALRLPERLDLREQLMAAPLDAMQARDKGLEPFYAAFDDAQKRAADQMLGAHMGMGMMGMM